MLQKEFYICITVANIRKVIHILKENRHEISLNWLLWGKKQLLVILLVVCSTLASAQTFTGRVVTKENNATPIPYAKLTFPDVGISILSDSAGYWEIENIPEGINQVKVSAVGYETRISEENFESGKPLLLILDDHHRQLDKLIVSNNGVLQNESITNIESIPLKDLNAIPGSTIGQSITNIPGVYQTGIGTGISKPVIRGLSGSSVVTYVNGLRVENQQWGADHGLPITSLGIGSVEVIKGPASLLYGADAMGGVIYFVDEPYAERNTYQAFFQSRFEHNSLGTINEAGFKISKEKLRMSVYAGYDNHADFGLPNGYQALNSRFKQSSAKFSLGYNKKKWLFNLRYNFYSGRIGLPGHTHEANPLPSDFQTTTQNRKDNVPAQVITNSFLLLENKFFLGRNEFYVSIGNTFNGLKEHEEKFFTPDIIVNLNNIPYNAKWKIRLNENLRLIVGSQGMFQQNMNGANAVEILIPDALTNDLGGYALLSGKFKKWRIQAGGRFDQRTIQTTGDGDANFSGSYSGFNFSSGAARVGIKSTLRFNVSSGFRAPNLSELLSDGPHHGSFRYEVGNQNLVPEHGLQFDLSYAVHLEDLELIINPFLTRVENYIYIQRTGEMIEEYEVFEYTQADYALLYGTDFGFHYHPHLAHWLHVESSFSTVFAEDIDKQPLPLIPQSRINTQLRFSLANKKGRKFYFSDVTIQHLYFFKQNRLGILETESPAYNLVNIGANMKADTRWPMTFSAGVRNLLNEEYISHLSGLKNLGLPNPGFNIYLAVKVQLSNKITN